MFSVREDKVGGGQSWVEFHLCFDLYESVFPASAIGKRSVLVDLLLLFITPLKRGGGLKAHLEIVPSLSFHYDATFCCHFVAATSVFGVTLAKTTYIFMLTEILVYVLTVKLAKPSLAS